MNLGDNKTLSTKMVSSFCNALRNCRPNKCAAYTYTCILNTCTGDYVPQIHQKDLFDLEIISTPQFFYDIYDQYVLQQDIENISIPKFIENSTFLSILKIENVKVYSMICAYLRKYTKYIASPINKSMFHTYSYLSDASASSLTLFGSDETLNYEDEYDKKCECYENEITQPILKKKNDLFRILYYTSTIHHYLRYRTKINVGDFNNDKMHQMDVIFVPYSIPTINCKYFDKLGITYKQLKKNKSKQHETDYYDKDLYDLIRQFDELNDTKSYSRSIILIMSNAIHNINCDELYIFKPLQNNTLPKQICDYSELPWICNSKADILPDLSPNDDDILSMSLNPSNRLDES